VQLQVKLCDPCLSLSYYKKIAIHLPPSHYCCIMGPLLCYFDVGIKGLTGFWGAVVDGRRLRVHEGGDAA